MIIKTASGEVVKPGPGFHIQIVPEDGGRSAVVVERLTRTGEGRIINICTVAEKTLAQKVINLIFNKIEKNHKTVNVE